MPKISVIVPIYNAENFLLRCVDSILKQTFADFELLLINDGSTDSSGEICNKYADMDSRVKVFHKANGGVSSARNCGLDRVQGEWITFVDSDDWLADNYLEELYDNSSRVDLVISYSKCFGKKGEIKLKSYKSRYVDSSNIYTLFLENDLNWQTSPWAKLYKRDLCADVRYIEGMQIGEDMVFLYTYIMKCEKVYVLGANNYNYDISHENSLTKKGGVFYDEIISYNNVCKKLEELIRYYQIDNRDVLRKIDWIKSYYINRLLNSLYNTVDLTQNERIRHILSLDLELYLSFYKITSIKERLISFLLRNKLFYMYDLFRILVVKFR